MYLWNYKKLKVIGGSESVLSLEDIVGIWTPKNSQESATEPSKKQREQEKESKTKESKAKESVSKEKESKNQVKGKKSWG